MTDEKIRAAVETAQKAIELSHRVPPEGLKKSKELMTLAHAVVELSAELTALKEKYRWRKQSEEPAPIGQELEIYSPIQERVLKALLSHGSGVRWTCRRRTRNDEP